MLSAQVSILHVVLAHRLIQTTPWRLSLKTAHCLALHTPYQAFQLTSRVLHQPIRIRPHDHTYAHIISRSLAFSAAHARPLRATPVLLRAPTSARVARVLPSPPTTRRTRSQHLECMLVLRRHPRRLAWTQVRLRPTSSCSGLPSAPPASLGILRAPTSSHVHPRPLQSTCVLTEAPVYWQHTRPLPPTRILSRSPVSSHAHAHHIADTLVIS